jgi:hypothetical protein
MATLIVHTDITGSPRWRDLGEPQPRVVRIVTADPNAPDGSIECYLVEPDLDTAFQPAAVAAHGIDRAIAQGVGMPRLAVLRRAHEQLATAHTIAAFSVDFHVKWLRREFEMFGMPWPGLQPECLMRTSTNLVRIPDMRSNNGFKWPKLTEAAEHFQGAPFEPSRTDPIADGMALGAALLAIYRGVHADSREAAA